MSRFEKPVSSSILDFYTKEMITVKVLPEVMP
jgi:hypothetical protein